MSHQVSAGPHLITTVPSLIECRKCRRPVMAATVAGLDRHIDTAMLNPMGEFIALLQGRRTYNLRSDVLSPRNKEKIAAGDRRYPVLADHTCEPVPENHLETAWMEAAAAIVIQACGGVIVTRTEHNPTPPF